MALVSLGSHADRVLGLQFQWSTPGLEWRRLAVRGPLLHLLGSPPVRKREDPYGADQYTGDVAAYVSPQVLDRFNELRREICDTSAKDRLRELLKSNPGPVTGAARESRPPDRPAVNRLGEIHVPVRIVVGASDIPDVHAHARSARPSCVPRIEESAPAIPGIRRSAARNRSRRSWISVAVSTSSPPVPRSIPIGSPTSATVWEPPWEARSPASRNAPSPTF